MPAPSAIWTQNELLAMHAEYLRGTYISKLAKRRHQPGGVLVSAWEKLGLAIKPRVKFRPTPRLSDAVVAAMHADYQRGLTLGTVERLHGRPHGTARGLFVCRGLALRDQSSFRARRSASGAFESYSPKTEDEITAIINSATTISTPSQLLVEWRKWPLAKRADLIRRLFARLKGPHSRPELPFSDNVEPFDYGSERAWQIIQARNAGRDSRGWVAKINVRSQGIIWDGRLWFWGQKLGGFTEGIRWTRGHSRPLLHRAIYERTHGPLPSGAVVRMRDGNPNNFDPVNLILSDQNLVCRENQARAITRKSRDQAAIILARSQRTHNDNDLISAIQKSK